MRRLFGIILLVCILAFPAALAETGGPPAFTLTRSLSREYAAAGGSVALSYTARNNSVYPITSLTISDALIGEVAMISRLEPGESATVVRRASIAEDCESQPSARFALGGRMHTVSIPAVQIRVEEIALTATLVFESRYEQAVLLTVTNGGNAPVYDVKAFDDALGDMGEAVERLDPGASATFRSASHGGRHQASVSAVSAGGQSISVRSNEITGEHGKRPVSNEPASLTAERDGDGRVFVSLFNPGPDTWRDVTLRELNSGGARTFSFVSAGESLRALWTPPDNAAGPFAFEALLPDGAVLSASLEAAQPVAPASTAGKGIVALNGPSFRMDEDPQTYRLTIYATAILMGLFLIFWWISARRRKRLARKKRLMRRREGRKRRRNKKDGEKTP